MESAWLKWDVSEPGVQRERERERETEREGEEEEEREMIKSLWRTTAEVLTGWSFCLKLRERGSEWAREGSEDDLCPSVHPPGSPSLPPAASSLVRPASKPTPRCGIPSLTQPPRKHHLSMAWLWILWQRSGGLPLTLQVFFRLRLNILDCWLDACLDLRSNNR